MKLWLRMLLLPLMPIFGVAGNEGGTDDGDDGDDGKGGEGGKPKTDPPAGEEKKFSQAEMNARAAAEKKQGKASAFKAVGFESEDQAKEAFKIFQALKGAKPDDIETLNKRLEDEAKAKNDALAKTQRLEYKLNVLEAGAAADSVDDIVTLAMSKMNDTTTFEQALEKVKEKHPNMFGEEVNKDTGRAPGGKRKPAGKDDRTTGANLGKTLAENKFGTTPAKSSFFK